MKRAAPPAVVLEGTVSAPVAPAPPLGVVEEAPLTLAQVRRPAIDLPLMPVQLPAPLVQAQAPRGGLVPLYVSFGVLQGLDVHSTRRALGTGRAREANPLLGEVADSSAGLVAAKIASTAVVIWGTERLRKKNRRAAVILMVGVNVATAVVVARNYRAVR